MTRFAPAALLLPLLIAGCADSPTPALAPASQEPSMYRSLAAPGADAFLAEILAAEADY